MPRCPSASRKSCSSRLTSKHQFEFTNGSFQALPRTLCSADLLQVINAKVPILKGTLLIDVEQQVLLSALALNNKAAAQSMAAASVHKAARLGDVLRVEMQVDISIGIADSQAAVHYLQRQVGLDLDVQRGTLQPGTMVCSRMVCGSRHKGVWDGMRCAWHTRIVFDSQSTEPDRAWFGECVFAVHTLTLGGG